MNDKVFSPAELYPLDSVFEHMRARLDGGDRSQILECLELCLLANESPPEWLVETFYNATSQVKGLKAKSWDDVFGKPHPKGVQLGSMLNRRKKSFPIYLRLKELLMNGAKTNPALFKKVGKEFGVSGAIAKKYYYEHHAPKRRS